jgi:hypothetical protein
MYIFLTTDLQYPLLTVHEVAEALKLKARVLY